MSELHLDLLRDPARTFPAVAEPDAIRSARIWHCKYASLAALAGLRNLEELTIATFPDASFDCLASLERLRYLRVLHLPHVRDIAPLAGLTHLRTLSLATSPGWDASGKTTTIASLEPLAAIPALARLELFGICPPNKSLAPLERCGSLRTARFSRYPQAEISRFYAATGVANEDNPPPSRP